MSGLGIQDSDKQIFEKQRGNKHRNSVSGSGSRSTQNVTTSSWRGAICILEVLVRANKNAVRTLNNLETTLKELKVQSILRVVTVTPIEAPLAD